MNLNPYFLSALEKLQIPSKDYQKCPAFQTLPTKISDPLWERFRVHPFELTAFEEISKYYPRLWQNKLILLCDYHFDFLKLVS